MATITIELTETQYKGLEYAALSPEDWATNAIVERCRISNDEIVQMTVQHCLDNGIQVPATREEIVAYAFDNEVVETAAVRQAKIDAEVAERLAAMNAEAETPTQQEGA
jgi:hypothetical protein